jgi:uncharacterized protein (TIGR03435 family)
VFGIALFLAAGPLFGQTPAFEVTSIKPSEPMTPAMIQSGKLHYGMKIDGKRVDIGNFRMMRLIMMAWDVKMYQVQGPPWLLTGQAFDIVANLPEGATKEQVPAMLQKLLAERFKLQVHTDTQPRAVYALVVAEGGAKLKESAAPGEDATPPPGVTGSSSASVNLRKNGGGSFSDGSGHKQTVTPTPDGKYLRFDTSGVTMAELAEGLSPMTNQPIVDKTGLKGRYDVTLDISMQDVLEAQRRFGGAAAAGAGGAGAGPDASKPAEAASDAPGSSLFTALKALGLKLEKRKEPMLQVFVDHCEKRPTDN